MMLNVFISTYIYCFQILLYFLVIWKVIYFQQIKNIISCFKATSASSTEGTPINILVGPAHKYILCFFFQC